MKNKTEHNIRITHLVIDYWIIWICVMVMMIYGTIPVTEGAFFVFLFLSPFMFLTWAWLCNRTSFNPKWCKKIARGFGYA